MYHIMGLSNMIQQWIMFYQPHNSLWINTLIAGAIMLISQYWRDVDRIFQKTTFWMKNYNVIELQGMVTEERSDIMTKFSDKMKAVIHHINTNCMYHPSLRKLLEISYNNYNFYDKTIPETEFLIDQNTPIEMSKDIFCSIEITKDNFHHDKKLVKQKDVTLYIYSKKKTIAQLKDYITKLSEDYDECMKTSMNSKNFCFILSKTSDEFDRPCFLRNNFQSTKTFDNLVFRDKEMLKQRLDFFVNNKEFYQKLGVPYTLGLLFHGFPGTGKTSTIKAIANYTNRHLIIIPMNKVKSNSALRDIILSEEIGHLKVPHSKRLYVFEEIDCNGLEDIIQSRQQKKDNTKEEVVNDTEISREDIGVLKKMIFDEKMGETSGLKRKQDVYQPPNDDKVTLGGLLELLDGINEATGRILVMTTNSDPNKFDAALMRPGRIDCKIEFKKCDHCELNQLFRLWFHKDIPKEFLRNIPEDHYTPAELGEIFIRNVHDPISVLKHLSGDITKPQTLENNKKNL